MIKMTSLHNAVRFVIPELMIFLIISLQLKGCALTSLVSLSFAILVMVESLESWYIANDSLTVSIANYWFPLMQLVS